MAKTVKKNEAKAKETAAPKKSVVESVVAESKQDEKVISLESTEKIESTDVSEIINNETTEEFTNLNTEIVEEGIVNLEGETKDESETLNETEDAQSETLNETEDTQSEATDESSEDDQPQETPVEEYASLPEDIWVNEPVTLDPTIFERIPVYPITPKYTACPPTALTKVSPSDTPKYNAQCPPKPDTEKAKSYVAQRPY